MHGATPLRPRSRSGRENCPGAGGAGAGSFRGRCRPPSRPRRRAAATPPPMAAPERPTGAAIGLVVPSADPDRTTPSTGRLATEMRAALITALGEPPNAADVDEPRAGDGETLVDVLASALNPLDVAVGSGRYFGGHPPLPYVPGAEAVGRVARAGEGAPAEGTLVYVSGAGLGVTRDGGLAERVAAPTAAILPLPVGADPGLAAALGIAAGRLAAAGLARAGPRRRSRTRPRRHRDRRPRRRAGRAVARRGTGRRRRARSRGPAARRRGGRRRHRRARQRRP